MKHQNVFRCCMHIIFWAFISLSVTAFAKDVSQADEDFIFARPVVPDPLQPFNRAMFRFNDVLDVVILKPVAWIYNRIMPKPLNAGIHNFFSNLNNVPTIANDILQLNFYQAANDAWRLGINSTIGIGGLFDVAERMGLPPYSNDFGLTLARYGWKCSTYVVLPFFGPNTFRDVVEIPVDYYAFSVYPYIRPYTLRQGLYALGIVDRRAQLLKFQPVLDEAALDKYSFIRDAYLQRRDFQIEQCKHRSYYEQRGALLAMKMPLQEEVKPVLTSPT